MLLYYHKYFVNTRLFPKLFLIFFLRKIPIFREKNFQQIISNKPAPAPTSESTEQNIRNGNPHPQEQQAPQPSTNKHLQHYASIILIRHCLNTETILRILTIFKREYLLTNLLYSINTLNRYCRI